MTATPAYAVTRLFDGGGEGGFSLVELVVVMGILMLVIGSLLGVMEAMTNSERRTSGRIDDEQSVRFVMATVTRDLRAANPVVSPVTPPGPHNQIDLCLGPPATGAPCGAGQVHVRWVYDPVTATLTRSVVAGGPPATQVLRAVVNGIGSPYLFTWYGQAQGSTAAPDISMGDLPLDLSSCAVSIRITIVSGAHLPTPPITESAEVALRNHGDGPGCS